MSLRQAVLEQQEAERKEAVDINKAKTYLAQYGIFISKGQHQADKKRAIDIFEVSKFKSKIPNGSKHQRALNDSQGLEATKVYNFPSPQNNSNMFTTKHKKMWPSNTDSSFETSNPY